MANNFKTKFFLTVALILSANNFVFAKVEYKSFDLADPFKPQLPKEEKEIIVPTEPTIKEEAVSLPELEIQGIVWNSDFPQGILDNRVVKVGDVVKEAKIISIEEKGISVIYKGKLFLIRPETPFSKKEKTQ